MFDDADAVVPADVGDARCHRFRAAWRAVRHTAAMAARPLPAAASLRNELPIIEQVMLDVGERSDVGRRTSERPEALVRRTFAPGWTTVFVRRLGAMQAAIS
jgi:hypothetical protein